MRLGLVGWPSDTGVGMELRDAIQHLPAASVLYMSHPGKPMTEDWRKKTVGEYDLVKKMTAWIEAEKIDTVLTWEVPGHWEFPALWNRMGVRWYCMVHWDWFAPRQMEAWKLAKILVPFELAGVGLRMMYGLEYTVLPVPVHLPRLPFRLRKNADQFVSVYGMGGPGDRRSIRSLVEAWRLLGKEAPSLLIVAQKRPPELEGVSIPETVTLRVGVTPTALGLYVDADVAILPSKFEGVGLSLIEAQACGLPVITTNMEPMRSIAPEYMVDGVSGEIEIMEGHKVATVSPTPEAIAARVRDIAFTGIAESSWRARRRVESGYSWEALRDRWIDTLES